MKFLHLCLRNFAILAQLQIICICSYINSFACSKKQKLEEILEESTKNVDKINLIKAV